MLNPIHAVVALYALVSFGAFVALVFFVARAARRQGHSLRPLALVAGLGLLLVLAIGSARYLTR